MSIKGEKLTFVDIMLTVAVHKHPVMNACIHKKRLDIYVFSLIMSYIDH